MNYPIFTQIENARIVWDYFSKNMNYQVIHILEQNIYKINWKSVSLYQDSDVIFILNKKLHKNCCCQFTQNQNSNVEKTLEIEKSGGVDEGHGVGFLLYSGERPQGVRRNINLHSIFWCILSQNMNPNAISKLERSLYKINWKKLSQNPNAISILERNLDKIDWSYLSQNPNAISILERNLDKIDWKKLSQNPNAISILECNLNKVNWSYLSQNPNAISILECNLNKVNWSYLSQNPNAISILERNLDKINWWYLSQNPNAISILERNLDKIDWCYLCKNPNGISILEKNVNKFSSGCWYWLSLHPNAISILERNLDKVSWECISENPNAVHLLFTYNYSVMKENFAIFAEELARHVFHPLRLMRFCEMYEMELQDYVEIIG